MTYTELWPAVVELPRVEKLRLLERLASELAQEEQPATIPENMPLPIWSPYDSYEAAAALMAASENVLDWTPVDAIYHRLASLDVSFSDSAELLREDRDR